MKILKEECKVTSDTGINKGAIEIPRRIISAMGDHESQHVVYRVLTFTRAYVPRRDGTSAIALYLPLVARFTTINDYEIKELILKVGAAINITAMFLKDSPRDRTISSKSTIHLSGTLLNNTAQN